MRWEGARFPILFKGGGSGLSPRFHLFVSDANQRERSGEMSARFSCVPALMDRLF